MIRSAGIVCKPLKEIVSVMVPPLVAWLRQRDIDVSVDEETAACTDCGVRVLPREQLAENVELLDRARRRRQLCFRPRAR